MILLDMHKSKFSGALALEAALPHAVRKKMILLSVVVLFITLVFVFLLPFFAAALESLFSISWLTSQMLAAGRFVYPIIPITLALLFLLSALESFWNSKTAQAGGSESGSFGERLDLYGAEVCWKALRWGAETRSLFRALPRARAGAELLVRLGIEESAWSTPLQSGEWQRLDVFAETFRTKVSGAIGFPDFVRLLFEEHAAAKLFLDAREISLDDLQAAARWVERSLRRANEARRWWRWENLARIPGLGKEWSYGLTPLLQQFGHDLEGEALRASRIELIGKDREIKLLESALLEERGANAIIVGEPGVGRHATLLGLVRMISWGTIFPALEGKRVFGIEGPALVATAKEKGEIEALLIRILNEAVEAGNIILVIDEFPEFIDSLGKLGVNAAEIMTKYLNSPAIHIIAIADTLGFRRSIEGNAALMKYFERVEIIEPDLDRLVEILEDHTPTVEMLRGVLFTYQSIEQIARGASEHLVGAALPERAIDLMEEVAEEAQMRGETRIMPAIVAELITKKTKIPLGAISESEQQHLIHLEEFLRKRVIGQDEAIQAISDAIRRARSGIKNPKKPIGSFLFLGPTGVGKTETAKALAESYFGSEGAMLRFDMTEYQGEDGFDKLVGSFEKNEPGLLASRMRASPYALVLLDEFEKSHLKVRNLFLQVLDEGFFTDYVGRKVNMRNTIIIATSNAGAKLIWDAVGRGIDPATLRDELFSMVQREGLYSPELLNRFDAVIIYHPLNADVLAKIARANLEKFVARLREAKNVAFEITEPLVDAVARGGYDPVFGARPMQRFIQDKVEKLVADKIIRGEVRSGTTFTFTPDEIATIV